MRRLKTAYRSFSRRFSGLRRLKSPILGMAIHKLSILLVDFEFGSLPKVLVVYQISRGVGARTSRKPSPHEGKVCDTYVVYGRLIAYRLAS